MKKFLTILFLSLVASCGKKNSKDTYKYLPQSITSEKDITETELVRIDKVHFDEKFLYDSNTDTQKVQDQINYVIRSNTLNSFKEIHTFPIISVKSNSIRTYKHLKINLKSSHDVCSVKLKTWRNNKLEEYEVNKENIHHNNFEIKIHEKFKSLSLQLFDFTLCSKALSFREKSEEILKHSFQFQLDYSKAYFVKDTVSLYKLLKYIDPKLEIDEKHYIKKFLSKKNFKKIAPINDNSPMHGFWFIKGALNESLYQTPRLGKKLWAFYLTAGAIQKNLYRSFHVKSLDDLYSFNFHNFTKTYIKGYLTYYRPQREVVNAHYYWLGGRYTKSTCKHVAYKYSINTHKYNFEYSSQSFNKTQKDSLLQTLSKLKNETWAQYPEGYISPGPQCFPGASYAIIAGEKVNLGKTQRKVKTTVDIIIKTQVKTYL